MVVSTLAVQGQSFTIPEGVMTYNFPAGQTSYLSFPLTSDPVYSDTVSSVTSTAISVANTSAFANSLANLSQPTSSVPYFVKFLSGAQMGRVMLVMGNSASSLTLDTTDHTSSNEPLTGNTDSLSSTAPTTFNVAAGDKFEVFPGDTLSTLFGNYIAGGSGNPNYPLQVTGGTSAGKADTIGFPTTASAPQLAYYFNTFYGYWVQYGGSVLGGVPANANDTAIYPYSALAILVRTSHPAIAFSFTGRVSEVPLLTKTLPQGTVYTSLHYAADTTLAQLSFGPNWAPSASNNVNSADTLGVYDTSKSPPVTDVYYQDSSLTWHQYPYAGTTENNYVIAAGSTLTLLQRNTVRGATCFLQSTLPYSVTQ